MAEIEAALPAGMMAARNAQIASETAATERARGSQNETPYTLRRSAGRRQSPGAGKVSRDNRGRADREYDVDQPGLTKLRNLIQTLVLIAVSIITVWTLFMVPSWQSPGDPFLLAAVTGAITVV